MNIGAASYFSENSVIGSFEFGSNLILIFVFNVNFVLRTHFKINTNCDNKSEHSTKVGSSLHTCFCKITIGKLIKL